MFDFNNIEFANPDLLYLLIAIPLIAAWFIFRRKKLFPNVKYSSTSPFQNIKPTIKTRLVYLPAFLRLLALGLLIIALARPRSASTKESIKTEGIDIIIAMDISRSMLAEDFSPNRIEVAKQQAVEFIDERKNDRIGLVVFAGESFTQCPITIDHSVLKNLFKSVETGMIEDGTAIGMGLATSVARLKESKADSRVIILLTDGKNNTGDIAPKTAAEMAKEFDIKVYTIAVGKQGKVPYPFKTRFGGTQRKMVEVGVDEQLLKEIAELTGGKQYRATGNESLEQIYEEIDNLEKTEIDVSSYKNYKEEFLSFAVAAAIFLILEILLRYLYIKKMP